MPRVGMRWRRQGTGVPSSRPYAGSSGACSQIVHGQARQGGQRLGRIGLFLQPAQGGLFVGHALVVLRAHARLGGCQAFGLEGVLVACDGAHLHLGHVPVLQERLADELFEVPLFERAAQEGEVLFVLEVGRGQVVVVEPARKRRHRKRHAVGHAEVALAHDEFRARERRLHERVVQPAVGQTAQRVVDDALEALRGPFFEALELDDRERAAAGRPPGTPARRRQGPRPAARRLRGASLEPMRASIRMSAATMRVRSRAVPST